MTEEQLAIIIQAVDRASPQLNRVAGAFERIRQAAEAARRAAAIALGSITAAVGGASKAFMDLEKRISNVRTMSRMTFDEMEKEIIRLSNKYGKAATGIADALYDVVSAGYDGAKAFEILEAAIQGAIVGASDIPTAVSATLTVLRSYGDVIENASQVQKLFFTAVQKGRLTLQDLAANIGEILPQAKAFGDSFENALMTLTFGTQVFGGQVAETATRIQNLYADLQQKAENFEKMGIKLYDATGRFVGLYRVFEQIYNLTKDMSTQEKNAFLNSLGLTDTAQEIVLAVINNFKEYKETVQAVGEVDFSSKLEEQMSTLYSTWNKTVEAAMNLARTLGDALAPAVKETLGRITEFINKLAEFVSKHKDFIKAFTVTVIKILSASLALLMIPKILALIMSPITWLLAGVALLAAAWALNWDGIRDKTKAVWEKIKPWLEGLKEILMGIITLNWSRIDEGISKLEELAKKSKTKIDDFVVEVIKVTFDFAKATWETVKEIWAKITKFFPEWLAEATSPESEGGRRITFKELIGLLIGIGKIIFEVIGERVKIIWDKVKEWLKTAGKQLYLHYEDTELVRVSLEAIYITAKAVKLAKEAITKLQQWWKTNGKKSVLGKVGKFFLHVGKIYLIADFVWAILPEEWRKKIDKVTDDMAKWVKEHGGFLGPLKNAVQYYLDKLGETTFETTLTVSIIWTGIEAAVKNLFEKLKDLIKRRKLEVPVQPQPKPMQPAPSPTQPPAKPAAPSAPKGGGGIGVGEWLGGLGVFAGTAAAVSLTGIGIAWGWAEAIKKRMKSEAIKEAIAAARKYANVYTLQLLNYLTQYSKEATSPEQAWILARAAFMAQHKDIDFGHSFQHDVNAVYNSLEGIYAQILLKARNYAEYIKLLNEFLEKLPKFSRGWVDEAGIVHGPGTETSDGILAWISRGEMIINAKSARKYAPLLKLINEDKLPGFAAGYVEQNMATLEKYKGVIADRFYVVLQYMAQHSQDTKAFSQLVEMIAELIKSRKEQEKQIEDLKKQLQDQISKLSDALNNSTNAVNSLAASMAKLRLKERYEETKKESEAFMKGFGGAVLQYAARTWKPVEKEVYNPDTGMTEKFVTGMKLGFNFLGEFISALFKLENFVKVIDFMGTIFDAMFEVIGPVINQALKPFVQMLTIVGRVIGTLLLPVLEPFLGVLQALANVIVWAYNSVIVPVARGFYIVFGMIATGFNWLYNVVSDIVKGLTFGAIDIGKRAVKSFEQIKKEAEEKISTIEFSNENWNAEVQQTYTANVTRSGPETVNVYQYIQNSNFLSSEEEFKRLVIEAVKEAFENGTLSVS